MPTAVGSGFIPTVFSARRARSAREALAVPDRPWLGTPLAGPTHRDGQTFTLQAVESRQLACRARLWTVGTPGGNPRRHGRTYRPQLTGRSNPEPFCSEVTVLTAAAFCLAPSCIHISGFSFKDLLYVTEHRDSGLSLDYVTIIQGSVSDPSV